MSYRSRIAKLEQEVDGEATILARLKPIQPYALLSAAVGALLALSTPKWVYYRDAVTRQKKINYGKLMFTWLILSALAGGLYHLYLIRGLPFLK